MDLPVIMMVRETEYVVMAVIKTRQACLHVIWEEIVKIVDNVDCNHHHHLHFLLFLLYIHIGVSILRVRNHLNFLKA